VLDSAMAEEVIAMVEGAFAYGSVFDAKRVTVYQDYKLLREED
jgi:hypothetical protein